MAPGLESNSIEGPRGQKRKHAASAVTATTTTARNMSHANSAGDGASAQRSRKRPTLKDVRTIPVQDIHDALRDGQLDLDAFFAARSFEIRALESSMHLTTSSSNTNAFQKVPRSMRRRTASHNPKRVPKRLRAKATRDLVENNTPLVVSRRRKPRTTKARIRLETAKRLVALAARQRKLKTREHSDASAEKDRPDTTDETDDILAATTPKRTTLVETRPARPKTEVNTLSMPPPVKSKFKKRQLDKTWLPTHVWHAKRARMTESKSPLWGFAVPLAPNEKVFRPTHRAQGDTGAIVWDMSYMGTIGLSGSTMGIERVLKAVGVLDEACWDSKGRKWRLGTTAWTGLLSRAQGHDRRLICPATIMWNPESTTTNTDENVVAECGVHADGQGKNSGHATSKSKTQRRRLVLLRVHPSAFVELFSELLRLAKMEHPRIDVEDLRYEIGSIVLTGPAATECLLGILRPIAGASSKRWLAQEEKEHQQHHGRLFSSLLGVTNPASLPSGAVLGFSIEDPRLRSPHRSVEQGKIGHDSLLELMASWPAGQNLAPFALWNRDRRLDASRLAPQTSIERRKGARMPGTCLEPTAADPPIPVVLVASSSSALPATDGRTPVRDQTRAHGTWTLLAPWKCIQPIWHCLARYPLSSGGNPRLGGLEQLRQVTFEQGLPWFPGDFPGTDAGAAWERAERQKRQAAWERRVKSKRIEWRSVDLGAGRKGEVGDGLHCDFEHLFGKDVQDGVSLNELRQVSKPDFARLVHSGERTTSDDHRQLDLPPNAVIQVRLSVLGRGIPTTCARVYALPSRRVADSPWPSGERVPDSFPPNQQRVSSVPCLNEVVIPATHPPCGEPGSHAQRCLDISHNHRGTSLCPATPADLRDQWLARAPGRGKQSHARGKRWDNQRQRIAMAQNGDLGTRKRLVAQSLFTGRGHDVMVPPIPPNQVDMAGHPLVPDENCLVGFVTTGSFCQTSGKGAAIACIDTKAAMADLRCSSHDEARLCVVRNAGDSVGMLARWDLMH